MESYLTAEISASAVESNLSLLRGRLSKGTKLCAVVKADCYGHGLGALLGVLARSADCMAVATPHEAVSLRAMGYERPILVFFSAGAHNGGLALRDALDELVARNITLTIASAAEVPAVEEAAARVGAPASVHIKVDSGMGRSGAAVSDVAEVAQRIRRCRSLRLSGMYTHFATADEADKDYARGQLSRFLAAVDSSGGREGLTLHAANSAGLIDLPDAHLDMVRPGIALYGYQPSDGMHNRLPLRPILRLTGPLMQIKDVPPGTRCGYGLTHTFMRQARTGLVPVGYGDGYPRSLSNRAKVRVNGVLAGLCGRVSMDQIIVDLTDVPSAKCGDVVEIISPDPADPHSVESIARMTGTIP